MYPLLASSDLLGPRRPARNEREARNLLLASCERLRASGAFAGRAPAVPANHLSGLVKLLVERASGVTNHAGPGVFVGPA